MIRPSKQSGFAALEGLLILVIIAIIGGTGWYVMKAKDSTDKTYSQTSNYSVAKASPKKTSSQQYLVIKEWGVKMLETDQSSDAYYVLDSSGGDNTNPPSYYNIDSHQLDALKTAAGTSCSGEYIGIIGRYRKDDTSWQSDPITVEEVKSGKTIGNYVYTFSTHKEYAADCLYDSTQAPIQPNLNVYDAKVKAYDSMFDTLQAE